MEDGTVSHLSPTKEEDGPAHGQIWCLKRVGKNSDWLRLQHNTEVTLGRGLNVTYKILSPNYPLMISRLHCMFKQTDDGQWTVTDKKSLNGVWVNSQRIPAEKPWPVKPGDLIQLGVPVEGSHVEFEYVLVHDSLHMLDSCLCTDSPAGGAVASRVKQAKRKLSADEPESKAKMYRCSSSEKSTQRSCPPEHGETQECGTPEAAGPSGVCQAQEHTRAPSVQEHTRAPSVQEHTRAPSAQEHTHSAQERTHSLQKRTHSVQEHTHAHNVQEQELTRLQQQLKVLQDQLTSHREQSHEATLCEEIEKWRQQEESLKKQLEETLLEHRKLIEELKHSRQGFEEILQAKDKELEATKEEKEKARAQKEEVVSQMTEVLENELQCIICSELFIEAVTLNCAHSFCLHCISAWRLRKDECPICRQAITSQTRSLVLDNCIDRMVVNLSVELRERRRDLVAQRKGELCQ